MVSTSLKNMYCREITNIEMIDKRFTKIKVLLIIIKKKYDYILI